MNNNYIEHFFQKKIVESLVFFYTDKSSVCLHKYYFDAIIMSQIHFVDFYYQYFNFIINIKLPFQLFHFKFIKNFTICPVLTIFTLTVYVYIQALDLPLCCKPYFCSSDAELNCSKIYHFCYSYSVTFPRLFSQ